MSKQCPEHVQKMSRACLKNVRTCPNNIQNMSKHVPPFWRSKQQKRISWPGTPNNMAKREPKTTQRGSSGRLQTLQIASNVPSRGVLELESVEKLIFEGWTVRNHSFGQCQGPPRRQQKPSQMLSESFCECLGDDQKLTPNEAQVKNRFLRCKPPRGFGVFDPGTWKMALRLYF